MTISFSEPKFITFDSTSNTTTIKPNNKTQVGTHTLGIYLNDSRCNYSYTTIPLTIKNQDPLYNDTLFSYPDINLPVSYDLPEQHIRHSSREMDREIPIEMAPRQLINPDSIENNVSTSLNILKNGRDNNNKLKDIHKVIILATIYFMLFTDIKVRTYIINILVVIFGDFLRTPGGGTSKMGWIFYALVFGLVLFITVSVIDISSYSIPF